MVRSRGRSQRGRRLVGRVPHGHWKVTTFVAGLRCGAVTAPFVIDQPQVRPAASPRQTIINAILDALAPLGIEHIDMPATPERVWRAIREGRPGQSINSKSNGAPESARRQQHVIRTIN